MVGESCLHWCLLGDGWFFLDSACWPGQSMMLIVVWPHWFELMLMPGSFGSATFRPLGDGWSVWGLQGIPGLQVDMAVCSLVPCFCQFFMAGSNMASSWQRALSGDDMWRHWRWWSLNNSYCLCSLALSLSHPDAVWFSLSFLLAL